MPADQILDRTGPVLRTAFENLEQLRHLLFVADTLGRLSRAASARAKGAGVGVSFNEARAQAVEVPGPME